ncbi:DNA repair protein rad18 [Xylariaceae sp. FL0662B]|nr:DNA repair protein rad18 [Xylariaceae sp. FL0662B]
MIDDPQALDSVSDSTDWLTTPLSGLTAVEAALRCQVCKDFYKTPMLTSCNHTFCSLCIRRALSNDGRCPLCRASEQEMRLRSNWSMEEVVAAFTTTRTDVLVFAQRPENLSTEPASKRKLDEMSDGAAGSPRPSLRLRRPLRSSARLNKSRQNTDAGFDETEEDDVFGIGEDEPTSEPEPEPEPDDGLVACPICWQRMRPLQVDKHIDTSCPGEPQAQAQPHRQRPSTSSLQSSWSTSLPTKGSKGPPRNYERLPALNYSMIKETQLRKKLAELGLSTAGNRQMLERRHKEWTTIWNANCDALRPRRKPELLHDLDAWERTLGTRAPTHSRSLNLGAQIKDKDFDATAWAEKHHSSFRNLIASAREGRAKAQQPQKQQQQQQDADSGDTEEKKKRSDPAIPQAEAETPAVEEEATANLQSSKEHRAEPPETIDLTDEIADAEAPRLLDRGRGTIERAPVDNPGTRLIS